MPKSSAKVTKEDQREPIQIKLPKQTFQATSGMTIDFQDLFGSDRKIKYSLFFFYPKDMTSGCTQEARDFQQLAKAFGDLGCRIFGVSRDSLESHNKFRTKESLTAIDLISDPTEILCKSFGVMKEKNMYGKKYMGVERSTFLIAPPAKVIQEWRGVKVPGHAQAVLQYLKALN